MVRSPPQHMPPDSIRPHMFHETYKADCGRLGLRVTGSLATVATSTLFVVAVEAKLFRGSKAVGGT